MLNKIFKLRKSNTKGFTLVEIIISLAIVGIIAGISFSIFIFGNNIFSQGTKQYDAQSKTRIVSDYIIDKTRFATDLKLIPLQDPLVKEADYSYIYIKDNKLNHYIWDGAGWDNVTIGSGIVFSSFEGKYQDNKTVLSLVLAGENETQDYELITEHELPNLTLKAESINASGPVIKYSTDLKYAYNGPVTTPEDPEVPEGPEDPLDPPEVTSVTVKFIVQANGYSLIFNGISIAVSGNPPREFIKTDVPVNADYAYEVTKKVGGTIITVASGTLSVGEEDVIKNIS